MPFCATNKPYPIPPSNNKTIPAASPIATVFGKPRNVSPSVVVVPPPKPEPEPEEPVGLTAGDDGLDADAVAVGAGAWSVPPALEPGLALPDDEAELDSLLLDDAADVLLVVPLPPPPLPPTATVGAGLTVP